jgi:hypothetical protein
MTDYVLDGWRQLSRSERLTFLLEVFREATPEEAQWLEDQMFIISFARFRKDYSKGTRTLPKEDDEENNNKHISSPVPRETLHPLPKSEGGDVPLQQGDV